MMKPLRVVPVAIVLGLVGCHPPSHEQWEMVFTAQDGTARLIAVSTEDLFAGWGMHTERVFPTHASCKGAWYDHASGRLATVEDAGNDGEVVRVYSGDGDVLSTYTVAPDVIGRVCHNPCLSDGGRRVALLGDSGAVFWADVGDDPVGNVRQLWQLWGTRADESRYGRQHWLRFARCHWIDESTLAVCIPDTKPGPPQVYCVDLEADKVRRLNKGHLAGVLGDSSIVATSYYSYHSSYQLENAVTGVALGTARVAHPYCEFKGISPSGQYILYYEPPTWGGPYVHHLESGRRAVLRVPRRSKLGSWSAVQPVNGAFTAAPAAQEQHPPLTARPEQAIGSYRFYPPAPAEARLQFLTGANGADDVETPGYSTEEFKLTEPPSVPRLMASPWGVAAHEGVIYVCDAKGGCICRLDYKNKTYSVFGGSGPGRLRRPSGIVIGPLGRKFVVDYSERRVVVFGPQDEYEDAFDLPFPCPVDLAIIGDEIYVLHGGEADPSRVVVLDRATGEFLRTFGDAGEGPGEFDFPAAMCAGPEGYLYVSESGGRLQKLTLDGESVWVRSTRRPQGLSQPSGVRSAQDGTLLLGDRGYGVAGDIHRFSKDGETLGSIFLSPDRFDPIIKPVMLAIDATSLPYFEHYIHKDFNAEYLLVVTSHQGPYMVSVYAVGSFPEGYEFAESDP